MRAQLFVGFLFAGCSVEVPMFFSEIDAGGDDDIDASSIDGPPADANCGDVCDSYCLRGAITVIDAFDVVNGNPSTMFFEHLQGQPESAYNLVFDVASSFTTTGDGQTRPEGQLRVLDVTIKRFTFADQQMNDRFGASYANMAYPNITLVNGQTRGVYMGNMVSPTGQEFWGWEVYSNPGAAQLQLDQGGFPLLAPTTGPGAGGSMILRRYAVNSSNMTDYASSSWTIELLHGADCL